MEWCELTTPNVLPLRPPSPLHSLRRWSTVSASIRMVAGTVTTSSRCLLGQSYPETNRRWINWQWEEYQLSFSMGHGHGFRSWKPGLAFDRSPLRKLWIMKPVDPGMYKKISPEKLSISSTGLGKLLWKCNLVKLVTEIDVTSATYVTQVTFFT